MTKIIEALARAAQALSRRGIREPVLLFGAIGASIAAWAPQLVDTDKEVAAVAAITLYLQRRFSTSRANAEDQVATAATAARHEALADVASLKAPAPARRARKTTKTPDKRA